MTECRRCPRLVDFLHQQKIEHSAYFNAPVPSFGAESPDVLIVGLAPGMHGANRTGRPFTGDAAGVLLYQTLYDLGLATAAESVNVDDGLQLKGVRICNAVRCLPPQNKVIAAEVQQCRSFLQQELAALPSHARVLALGVVAHRAVLQAYGETLSCYPFAHARRHLLTTGRVLFDSYHCSRYNTQTGRLTATMFRSLMHEVCLMED